MTSYCSENTVTVYLAEILKELPVIGPLPDRIKEYSSKVDITYIYSLFLILILGLSILGVSRR